MINRIIINKQQQDKQQTIFKNVQALMIYPLQLYCIILVICYNIMKNNDNSSLLTLRPNPKCVDLLYFITTTLYFIGLLIFAIILFNPQQLKQLSMPRNSNGNSCSPPTPYLHITGPSIIQRQCTYLCEQSEPNHQLGGICIPDRVESILKQNGEYDKYIGAKLNSLNRLKIVLVALTVSLALALLLSIASEFSIKCCSAKTHTGILILASIVIGVTTLYFLLSFIDFPIWVTISFFFTLYMLYLGVYKTCRSNRSTSSIHQQSDNLLKHTFWKRLAIALLITSLVISFGFLLLFQYLAFISKSPFYGWVSPALFAEVNGLTWRELLVIGQGLYLLSFTSVLNEYLVGSLTSNSLGMGNAFYSLIRCHLGSVCKLALIRLFLSIPIFFFTLIKPFQHQNCANCCHCLCGCILNFCRRYSLPVLAYQTALKQTIDLGEAASRVHYQAHINQIQYSDSYIEKLATLVIVTCGAVGTVLICETKLGLKVSLMTLVFSVIFSLWASYSFASTWIHAKDGSQVRKICQKNRSVEGYTQVENI